MKEQWIEKIWNKQAEIDPKNELCWRSMAIGFAIGFGALPKTAEAFADTLQKENLL